MNLYFAPLEGITTYTYRNIHSQIFGGCDAYFSPFICPSPNEKVSRKMLKDILPENNGVKNLVVQILCNHPDAFKLFADKVSDLGYDEINLNLGCPSGTVTGKGRGAGFLKYPEELDRFLDAIFSQNRINISVKTRLGFIEEAEFENLMEIYNRYPIKELTIHPRVRMDFYKGYPRYSAFSYAYHNSKNPLCYNGNVFDLADFNKIENTYPKISSVMLGRGAVANPALFREIKGGNKLTTAEALRFTLSLKDSYYELFGNDTYTIHKLKEIWLYMMWNYPEEKKILKCIKKAQKLADFMSAVESLPEI